MTTVIENKNLLRYLLFTIFVVNYRDMALHAVTPAGVKNILGEIIYIRDQHSTSLWRNQLSGRYRLSSSAITSRSLCIPRHTFTLHWNSTALLIFYYGNWNIFLISTVYVSFWHQGKCHKTLRNKLILKTYMYSALEK